MTPVTIHTRVPRSGAVSVRLEGGLGNQLFQYAAGRAHALRTGAKLVLDLSWYVDQAVRPFALSGLDLQVEGIVVSPPGPFGLNRLIDRAARRLGLEPLLAGSVFREAAFAYDSRFEKLPASAVLRGYFQSWRYFADVSVQIGREVFPERPRSFAVADLCDEVESLNSIAVHIRRGDYVDSEVASRHHGTCSPGYYKAAIDAAGTGDAAARCYVFSDDPAWCREHLDLGSPTTWVSEISRGAALDDFAVMARCRHFVVANSSFSWWAAWLGRHPDKRVCAPARWFQAVDIDTRDLCPPEWIRIAA